MPEETEEQSRGMFNRGATETTAQGGLRYLLTIAIDKYESYPQYDPASGAVNLKYPVSDAQKLKDLLESEYGFVKERTTSLEDHECTENNIRDAITDLQEKIKPEDELVVFFAGHGATDGKDGYWITYDSKVKVKNNLRVSDVVERLVCDCSQIILIVDCCYGGTIAAKAEQLLAFQQVKYQGSAFSIITSGNLRQAVPDKSLFMETLLQVLKINSVENFNDLVGDLQAELKRKNAKTVLVSHTTVAQEEKKFLLRRTDEVSHCLAESFFDLNFRKQTANLVGVRPVNVTYLRGTPACAHHIFTQRYFRAIKIEHISMFNSVPRFIPYGTEAASGDYSLWKKLAREFGTASAQPAVVWDKLLEEMALNDVLIFVKIDPECSQAALEKEIEDFWNETAKYLDQKTAGLNQQSLNKLHIFIWDRRGFRDDVQNILRTEKLQKKATTFYRLLILDPVDFLDIEDDVGNWQAQLFNDHNFLMNDASFSNFNKADIEAPLSMENVILQITALCQRPKVYDLLFTKKMNTWVP